MTKKEGWMISISKKRGGRKAVQPLLLLLVFVISAISSVYAVQELISLQGKVTTSAGALVSDGNLTVLVYDSPTGGNMVYNSSEDFNTSIQSGSFDVLLGSITDLHLNLSDIYYMDLEVNGEDVDWDGEERKQFQSGVGRRVSGNFSVDLSDSTFFVDDVNNRIGVGTSSPGAALEVTNSSVATLFLNVSSGDDLLIINSTGIDLGSGLLYVDPITNKVGIGTTTPATSLQVWGDGTYSASFMNGNVGIGDASPTSQLSVTGDVNATGSVRAPLLCVGTDCRNEWPSTSSAGGWTDDGSIVRLTTGDDIVGIGTSTPAGGKLYVAGNGTYTGDLVLGGDLVGTEGSGASGAGLLGWVDDGTVVRLATSTDFVGIGTSSPGATLEVVNQSAVNALFNVTDGSDTRFLVNGAGNVGIGTTTPITLLQLGSDSGVWAGGISFGSAGDVRIFRSAEGVFSIGNNAFAPLISLTQNIGGGVIYGGWDYVDTNRDFGLRSASGKGIGLLVNGGSTPSVYVKSDGNVGIGTSSPGAKLEVINDSAYEGLLLNITNGATDFVYNATTGNVGIGTTSPGEKLDVNGQLRYGVSQTVSGAGSINFSGLDGDVDKIYELTLVGHLNEVGGSDGISLFPNNITTNIRGLTRNAYQDATSPCAYTNPSQVCGFTSEGVSVGAGLGWIGYGTGGDIFIQARIMAATGSARIFHVEYTVGASVDTNLLSHTGFIDSWWSDTTTNINSLIIDIDGSSTFTGTAILRTKSY